MARRKDKLSLGAFLLFTGHHVAAWRSKDASDSQTLQDFVQFARLAEDAKFDAVFLADQVGVKIDRLNAASRKAHTGVYPFEPLTLLSALSAVTSRIGLVATVSTSYNEPFNVARQFASLDRLSGGRAGWNLVTSTDASAALNFNHDGLIPHADRYARAEEFADVVNGLWDSWEDDAFVGDRATVLFVDTDKLQPIAHHGQYFNVHGPLNLPRTPQGYPVLFQAGGSSDGRELAARHAEAVFSASQSFEESLAYRRDINQRAEALGRGPGAVKILPGLTTIIGATEAQARRRRDDLIDLIPWDYSLNRLAGTLGIAVDRLSLDAPLPDGLQLPANGNHTFFRATLALAQREGLTVRALIRELAGGGGHRVIVGTPEQIADDIEHWFRHGAADGFNLMPDVLPGGVEDFVDGVVPILQRRGLFRTEYTGRTLRDHMGLARPAGRTREQAAA